MPGILERVHQAGAEIVAVSLAAGGVLSGEHGVGLEKRDHMPLVFSPDDLDAQTLVADLDLLGGQVEDAFTRLIDLVRRTSGDERNLARQHLIGLFAAEQQAQGKPRIRIGVGVASGSVIAGYAGTQHRATYTCVGDVVNLAARLEAHTKDVGEPLIVDGDTLSRLENRFDFRSHGEARLKGKVRPVAVFSISGERA